VLIIAVTEGRTEIDDSNKGGGVGGPNLLVNIYGPTKATVVTETPQVNSILGLACIIL